MTKHETREYAFLLLYEAMVRTEELNTIEDLYASTEEMLELPIPEKGEAVCVRRDVPDRGTGQHYCSAQQAAQSEPCAGSEPFDPASGTVRIEEYAADSGECCHQ